jgi:hypothetical protein
MLFKMFHIIPEYQYPWNSSKLYMWQNKPRASNVLPAHKASRQKAGLDQYSVSQHHVKKAS